MSHQSFRDYLYPIDHPRVASIRGIDAHEYAEVAKTDSFAGPMIEGWAKLYPQPFVGVTTDGTVRTGLFRREDARPGEEAPSAAMTDAALALFATLDAAQLDALRYPLDAHEWRSWANPEFLQHDTGLRLDELGPEQRDACLALVEASLSDSGYALVRRLMYINGYLGAEVGLPQLMNEFSYNIAVYGDPSAEHPWGWHLFGHHVAVNCAVIGTQIVMSPLFLGAEPSVIDDPAGNEPGLRVFDDRIDLAREFMTSLSPELQRQATSYENMVDPAMPAGRLHPGDERHLGGCFQDNVVVPFEGVVVGELDARQQALASRLLDTFLEVLPAGPRAARLREIEGFFDETWFSWIGSSARGEPFYFRLQSPVVMAELDHHSGVFLSNEQPAVFHIHTVLRTPNGNDYGRALIGPLP